jgi:hypothetical protein
LAILGSLLAYHRVVIQRLVYMGSDGRSREGVRRSVLSSSWCAS